MGRVAVITLLAVLSITATSQAELVWDVNYTAAQVPSAANPAWAQGGAAPAGNTTVSGGATSVMTMTNAGTKTNYWQRTNDAPLSGVVSTFEYDDPTTSEVSWATVTGNAFTLEWKMKVNTATAVPISARAGVLLYYVKDSTHQARFTFYYDSVARTLANTLFTYPTAHQGIWTDSDGLNETLVGDGFSGIDVGTWYNYKLTSANIGGTWIRELWLSSGTNPLVFVGRWSDEYTADPTTTYVRMSEYSTPALNLSFDDVRYDDAPDGRFIRPVAPIVTGSSPTKFGKPSTPPSAYIILRRANLKDPPPSEWTATPTPSLPLGFKIDTGGVNRIYEIDTDGQLYEPTAVPLTLTTAELADTALAGPKIAQAINDDAGALWTAYFTDYGCNPDTGECIRWIALTWKDESHYGAANAEYGDDTTNYIAFSGPFSASEPDLAPSYFQIQGEVGEVTTVTAAPVAGGISPITGTITYKPDGSNMTVRFPLYQTATVDPPLGMYNVVLNSASGATTITDAFELVDNLLHDPSFYMHSNGATNPMMWNSWGGFLSPFWKKNTGTAFNVQDVVRKGYTWELICPRSYPFVTGVAGVAGDNEHGSIQTLPDPDRPEPPLETEFEAFADREMYQVVKLDLDGPELTKKLTLTGLLGSGTHSPEAMTYGVQMRQVVGTTETVIAQTPPSYCIERFQWRDFSLTGEVPTGPVNLKVVFWASGTKGEKALHFDNLLLRVDSAATIVPALTAVMSGYGARGGAVNLSLVGTFRTDSNVLLRRAGQIDIPAASVSATETTINATFNLAATTALGYWDVVVTVPGHGPLVAGQAFNIVLPDPGFGNMLSNGDFEQPTHADQCPLQEPPYGATDWIVRQLGWYFRPSDNDDDPKGDWWDPVFVRRDITSFYAPTHPAPVGFNFAGTWSTMPEPNLERQAPLQVMQTVTVTPGATYTLSGFFAGMGDGGKNTANLKLLDGDCTKPVMTGAQKQVYDGIGSPVGMTMTATDWTFHYVTGTATTDLATAVWETVNEVCNLKRSYADGLQLEKVTGTVSISAVSPANPESVGTGINATFTVTGSGFSGGTPEIYVVRPGYFHKLTNVTVTSNTSLVCTVDIPAEASAVWDVIVHNHGAFSSTLPAALKLVPSSLINGEFEEPCPALVNCNPRTKVTTPITGWSFADELSRNDTVHQPDVCLNGYYASMTTGLNEEERAWQTIMVTPYKRYKFSGQFAGGGSGTVTLKLIDGSGLGGTVLDTQPVTVSTVWAPAYVEAVAQSSLMTVVWEMTGTSGSCAVHADALEFEFVSSCHTVEFDTDNDTDVDQDDFAFFQRCITTGYPANGLNGLPEYCGCFDVYGPAVPPAAHGPPDGQVNDLDLQAFLNCCKGPNLPIVPSDCP